MRLLRLVLPIVLLCLAATAQAQVLPSWNEGTARRQIVDFVQAVTAAGGKDFVPREQRIAVFDNDGTLWSEQPLYFELAFILDRIRTLAPQHPDWKTRQPFKAILEGDHAALTGATHEQLDQLFMASHAGMTPEQFRAAARAWLESARHPKFRIRYLELVYQPMLELLVYLRDHGFKTYIVTGGTTEFVRAFAGSVYGIPPEQVIGSTVATKFEMDAAGAPELMRQPKLDYFNDGPGKPVAIERVIGRRPILAFGNSDGDQQMLEWTAAGEGARFMGLIRHTDAAREFAYDRGSRIGKLDKALDEATARGWTIVDMKQDWRAIYPSAVPRQSLSR
jgi:phosphoglycolate phosphatase-like HAD superfamily hydrolase